MKKLNFIQPVNLLSYGVVGTNIAVELAKLFDVTVHLISGEAECEKKFGPVMRELISKKYDARADCVKVWHSHDLKTFIGNGRHFGFPIFELDGFPESEIHDMGQLDGIFVCSKWAKNVLVNCGLEESKIFVVPLGVDRDFFHSYTVDNEIAKIKSTKFLNCGKFEIRKGHDILVDIFNKAFCPSDDVLLVLNCNNYFLQTQRPDEQKRFENMYKNSKMGEKILIFNKRLPDTESVANLMNSVDFGIFPARAEGWNLELLEMMSCGKKCIATNVTAHTEYANSNNCELVECPNKEKAFDGMWFDGSHNWYEIGSEQIDRMAQAMVKLHELKQGGADITNYAGIETAKQFSWANSASKIRAALEYK